MNLRDDIITFNELLTATALELDIPIEVIEKDYYVTLVLKELSTRLDNMVFKGGTSLMKCYQIIDRFSEDIDISYTAKLGHIGESRKRKLKQAVIEAIENINLSVNNLDDTRSRRHYNCYKAKYNSIYNTNYLNPELIVETYIALHPYPSETRYVDNFIYRYLNQINELELIQKYNLMPFPITVQSLERTLVDKVFALCDYYLTQKINRHSRHIYDIHMICKHIELNHDIKALIHNVREDRSNLSICPSANKDININQVLKDIMDKEIFKQDYEELTLHLLFKPVSYQDAISSLQKIIQSQIFDL